MAVLTVKFLAIISLIGLSLAQWGGPWKDQSPQSEQSVPKSQVTGNMWDDDEVGVALAVLAVCLSIRPSLQTPLLASGQELSHMTILVDVPGIHGGCLPGGRAVDRGEGEEGVALLARREDWERRGTGDDRDPVAEFPELLFCRP